MKEALYEEFILILNKEGEVTRTWLRAEKPIPWAEARARLLAAETVRTDGAGRRRLVEGGWMLSVDPHELKVFQRSPLAPRPLP